ncbi:MAG: glycosyltransferase family 39 protein, partial [Thermodesulfovibrionales bacterium]|nr:glycosyltransferase family 39 protein [Thermodesulfovibrionales bacterium]
TAVSFFGSSLSSSLSTALWNLNFEVLLITFCLLLLAAHDRGRLSSPKPYLLGVLLALAFACRPTAALFILACFLYLYLTDIRALLKTAAASFAGLVVFMAFSLYTYGMILPPYYFTKASGGSIPTAFYGVLLSPSRGLLIFSPFIALVLIYAFALRKQLKGFKIFWLVLSWPVLHIALVSNTSFWWGGNCFGSRLLTDSLPAYILLTFLILRVMNEKGMDLKKPLTVFLAAGALAIWINTYQGLFNKWTAHWNGNPYVNEEHALDWRYPQFLMNGQRLKERVLEHLGRDKYWIYVDEDNHTLSIVPYQKR